MSTPAYPEIDAKIAFEELTTRAFSDATNSDYDTALQNVHDHIEVVDNNINTATLNSIQDTTLPDELIELLTSLSVANNIFDYTKHLTTPYEHSDGFVSAFEEVIGCKPQDATDSAYDDAELHLLSCVDSLHGFIDESLLIALDNAELNSLSLALYGLTTANDIYNLAKTI